MTPQVTTAAATMPSISAESLAITSPTRHVVPNAPKPIRIPSDVRDPRGLAAVGRAWRDRAPPAACGVARSRLEYGVAIALPPG
jgi:hypothetical protein